MNRSKMEAGITTFLEGLGEGFDGDDQGATPKRVAKAWVEDLVSGYAIDPEQELSWTPTAPGGGPVLVDRIRFASICVHHLLPFFGLARVAYLPGTRQAGLSKLGRVVDAHSRRLQTQERLSAAVAETIHRVLEPRGVIAIFRAEHTCMTLRGVRKEQSRMMTVATTGIYADDATARAEVMGLLGASGPGSG